MMDDYTELDLIAIIQGDRDAGIQDETYEIKNIYIDDIDHTHREMVDYEEFIKRKIVLDSRMGFDVAPEDIHPMLFPHQRDCVIWALRGGRRALFESYGLGKTFQQLEILTHIGRREGGRQLIIAPLGVRGEFKADAVKLEYTITFVRWSEDVGGDGIYITNYESVRDGRLDVNLFNAVSLDEASVLRSYGSITFQTFLTLFHAIKYRFVATATPSPNRFKELIHYAGFLGISDTGLLLTKYFQRDSTQANNLTLYPHKAKEFWMFLATWAIFLQKPSQLGYSDEGYDLPALNMHYCEIEAESTPIIDRDGQMSMFNDASMSLKAAAKEKRESLDLRVKVKMVEIINQIKDGEQLIIWCDLDNEQREVEKVMVDLGISFVSLYGNTNIDAREYMIQEWKDKKRRAFISKPKMYASGINMQQCHIEIYVGINFKANDFLQGIHRVYRFQQEHDCDIYIIHTDTERGILDVLKKKWKQHDEMVEKMTNIIKKYGLSHAAMEAELRRAIGVERVEVSGDGWLVALNDCVPECAAMEESSVGLIHTSVPFANHYEYTPSYNDFGHSENNAHFWKQMDYLTPNLFRILKPGRIAAIHIKNRILFGNVTGLGFPTCDNMLEETSMHFQKHGFKKVGIITVVTDVVRENNQTYRLGWTENCKDGSKMGVGCPEYIMIFRKPQTDLTRGYADDPVVKTKDDYSRARWQVDAHAFWRSSGDRLLTADELTEMGPGKLATAFTDWSLKGVYDYDAHVKIGEALELRGALPAKFMAIAPGSHHPDVWHNVNRMLTLNGNQSRRRLQLHVCLAAGSLVLTKCDGYKPIEQVTPGELVFTHQGRWRPVLAAQFTGRRPAVEVRAQGVPGLTLTPDHKLWTRRIDHLVDQSQRSAKRQDPGWVEAQNTLGSYINRKLPDVEPTDISPSIWWVIGRWLADGHYHEARDGVHISCATGELGDLILNLGEFAPNGVPRQTGPNCFQVLLSDPDRTLREIIKRCGCGAADKHIPPEAFTLPPEHAKAMLDGYLSGDGHYLDDRRRWTASSVSRELLLGLAFLAHRAYGAVASVYPGRPARTGSIEGRTVNMRQDWVFCFDFAENRRKRAFIVDDGAWLKVRSVTDAGEVDTWNLRVDEDESFTAEGCIVKNCPLQFDIVDRIITRYSNKGDIVFDPFAGLGTVPMRAVKLGRQGRGVELNPESFRDSIGYMRSAEMEAKSPSLLSMCEFEEVKCS